MKRFVEKREVKARQWFPGGESFMGIWEDGTNGDIVGLMLTEQGLTYVAPGDWVVCYEDGDVCILAPELFHQRFTESTTEESVKTGPALLLG